MKKLAALKKRFKKLHKVVARKKKQLAKRTNKSFKLIRKKLSSKTKPKKSAKAKSAKKTRKTPAFVATARKRVAKFKKGLTENQKKSLVCLLVLAIICIGLGANVWWKNRPASDKPYSKTLSQSTALESHMMVVGDIYWGRRMHDWSQKSPLKEAYPFSRLNEFHRDRYDAWIGNLECPSDPGVKQAVGYEPKLTEFNCDAAYLPHAAKWFDIFSLANNHTMNQSREKGLIATRKELRANGIQHFGDFNPHIKKNVCEVVSLPVRVRLDGKQQDAKLPIAMCGFHGMYYTIKDESIAVIREYSKVMPVVAMPHMGQEYQAIADEHRRELYQKIIDNGADAVIGNHPHWVQPTEAYKGKLIVYSMGNFIFDQDFSQEVMRSAAIDIIMKVNSGSVSAEQLRAWTNIGKNCSNYHDSCLADAQAQQLTRLPVTFSYDVIGVDTSNKITKPANLRSTKAIIERLGWEKTQQQLNATR